MRLLSDAGMEKRRLGELVEVSGLFLLGDSVVGLDESGLPVMGLSDFDIGRKLLASSVFFTE